MCFYIFSRKTKSRRKNNINKQFFSVKWKNNEKNYTESKLLKRTAKVNWVVKVVKNHYDNINNYDNNNTTNNNKKSVFIACY